MKCHKYLHTYSHRFAPQSSAYIHQVSFRGGHGGGGGKCRPLDHKCPFLEFEKPKLLDMSNTSVKSQETLVVSLGKHDITNSKNRHL